MEQFTIRYAGDTVTISSHIAGLAEMTKQAITPAFAVSDAASPSPDWEIEACIADNDWKSFRENRANIRPVKLVVYPELREYVVREYSADRIRLCTAPLPKIPWFALESDLRRKKWTLYFDPEDQNSLWFLFRMLLLYFGTRALSRGHRFLHASGVSLNGEAILFSGPKGSGKSSLMYLACSRVPAHFVADDQVVLHFDGECRLQTRGWPRRANLGLSLLGKEALSKSIRDTVLSEAGIDPTLPEASLSDAWRGALKSSLHQHDFLQMFGFQSELASMPVLLVFPQIDESISHWVIAKVADNEARALLEANIDVAELARYITDYLGLLDQKPKQPEERYFEALLSLPKVRVTIGSCIGEHFQDFWGELLAFKA